MREVMTMKENNFIDFEFTSKINVEQDKKNETLKFSSEIGLRAKVKEINLLQGLELQKLEKR